LVEEVAGGNPSNRRRWVRRSLRNLVRDLRRRGHVVSRMTVGRLLQEEDYGLKANCKRFAGPRHPDRDRQFRQIARLKRRFLRATWPVISVDTKKKELIGNFKNAGRRWCREAAAVSAYDFPGDAVGCGHPYGLFVVNQGRGFVEVGTSADTAEFAVDAIAHWWRSDGHQDFPAADRLLILADAGGSNGCRPRLWKLRVQERLADAFGLTVTVCHYPRGASKYNPVERRLFSPISCNWAGEPLRSFAIMLSCIRGTRTANGLPVRARLNRRQYRTKIKITDEEMRLLSIRQHEVCPRWTYTIRPRTKAKEPG
jgi:Rhodopirellula transposase DDE domain